MRARAQALPWFTSRGTMGRTAVDQLGAVIKCTAAAVIIMMRWVQFNFRVVVDRVHVHTRSLWSR